jgi:hypothetical protein
MKKPVVMDMRAQCLADGINPSTMYGRRRRGWSPERMKSQPVKHKRKQTQHEQTNGYSQ